MKLILLVGLWVGVGGMGTEDLPARIPTLQRLQLERLRAVHEAREVFSGTRHRPPWAVGLNDYRAVIHAHSFLSHDSRGTWEEITAAAHETGTQVLLMTEHPAEEYDVLARARHGLHEGVLFIPGTEENQLLTFPRTLRYRPPESSRQAHINRILADGGLVFIAHPEELTDWNLTDFTGLEIYNIHADFKDERELLTGLERLDPKLFLLLLQAERTFPQEMFASLTDVPRDNLRRWDQLNQRRRVVGIAANDAHSNTGFVLKVAEGGKVRVEDILGEDLALLDPTQVPLLPALVADKEPGTEVLRLHLDPYARSFRHVGTHILAPELTEEDIRAALAAGRCYVSFDWIADARGFVLWVEKDDQKWLMGEEVPWQQGLTLRTTLPCPAEIRIVGDGKVVHTVNGPEATYPLPAPGVYRVEVYVTLAGEVWPWIYSNPLRVLPRR